MAFRTVEISDPKFERDHLRFLTVKTASLKGRGDVCVFVPPGIDKNKNYPVVILLHGVYGSAWSWPLKTGVHLKVLEMIEQGALPPVIIAMPSDGLWGDGSAYLPHNSLNFEKWIAEDVPQLLIQHIKGAGKDSPFFIAGLSMGGFGALRIGVKYHHFFKAVAGHSSITSLPQMKLFVEEPLEAYEQEDKTEEDVLKTILRYKNCLPPLRFDCGKEDLLIDYNRQLHQQLLGAGIEHVYEEYSGGHEWSYWEEHVIDSLLFFKEYM